MVKKPDSPQLLATFLDVGQGDATAILLPDGSGILVDCAAGSAPIVLDHLEQAKVNRLEVVIISHSDLDHAGDMVTVLNSFQGTTKRLAVLPDRVRTADPQADRMFKVLLRDLAQLIRRGVEPVTPYAGEVLQLSDVTISVLHPSEADHLEALAQNSTNDSSVVVMLEYLGIRILLSGDAGRLSWQWMIDRKTDLKADIFKFPHHGGWYNGAPSLDDVLAQVNPSFAVISVGSSNGYAHPSKETFRALRSRGASFRFVCTQATAQCHRELQVAAGLARTLLLPENQGGHSYHNDHTCPCAGSVTVRISSEGATISPSTEQHNKVIKLFESPQCREAG